MPTIPLHTILSYFETGDFPTQEQFASSWSSFYHKDDSIPMDKVENLSSTLQDKTDKSLYEGHLNNADAHITTLVKLDGSNLNDVNIQAWKTILGVGSLPANMATVDDLSNNIYGNVWTKEQGDTLYMIADQFVQNGKIRADKIQALGLTELITVSETSLPSFMANNGNYVYEKNDMIAIPDGNGNFSLYIYKGGNKATAGNYIATGLSNITVAMVQGLQTMLDAKLDKPNFTGNYFIRNLSGGIVYASISPAVNYLLFWDGSDFRPSNVYHYAGKVGIGNNTPGETLHVNGRMRAKAVVFDDNNTETLPNQITVANRKMYFTDSTGTKKQALMKEDLTTEFINLPSQLTDTQRTNWKTAMNGGWTTNTMSVFLINPMMIKNTNEVQYISVMGANLNFNPASFSVEICTASSTAGNVTVIETIDNSKVQLSPNGLILIFYHNFSSYAQGSYKIRLWNGIAYYLTSVTFEVATMLNSYDLSALSWDIKVIRNDIPLDFITDSNGAYVKCKYPTMGGGDWAGSGVLAMTVSSSAFGNMSDDFVIELSTYSSMSTFRMNATGLTNETKPMFLNNLIGGANWSNGHMFNILTGELVYGGNSMSDRIFFIKKGSIMTVIVKGTSSIAYATNSVSTDSAIPVKFKMCLNATDIYEAVNNLKIISAYKLN